MEKSRKTNSILPVFVRIQLRFVNLYGK